MMKKLIKRVEQLELQYGTESLQYVKAKFFLKGFQCGLQHSKARRFSARKWYEDCKDWLNMPYEQAIVHYPWVKHCDGKTEDECFQLGYITSIEWLE